MFDRDLVHELLSQILWSARTIAKRCAPITSAEDFTGSDEGLEKLDAICMQLIALGESIKNLDKATEGKLLIQYSAIEWKRVMGMRDIISHHYFDLDAEVVYAVCTDHIEKLAEVVQQMRTDIR
jgi:uncharacterized protein with HEPN domain